MPQTQIQAIRIAHSARQSRRWRTSLFKDIIRANQQRPAYNVLACDESIERAQ
jgi:hypothetical protein